MNESVKPLVWVLVVPDLTQTNRYPLSLLTLWRRLIVLVARLKQVSKLKELYWCGRIQVQTQIYC